MAGAPSLQSEAPFLSSHFSQLGGLRTTDIVAAIEPAAEKSATTTENRELGTENWLLKFQGDKLRLLLGDVGERVRISTRQPLDVASLELSQHRPLAFHVAAYFQIADRDQQVRASMMMPRNNRAG